MSLHVAGVFDARERAAQTVRQLKDGGFSDREFTVVAQADEQKDAQAQAERATQEENGRGGAWAGSALGAAVAGTAGLLSIALIPAVPLLMVGGAAAGGVASDAVARFGSGQLQNERTQQILRSGGALIVVHAASKERAELARDLLTQGSAQDVAITSD